MNEPWTMAELLGWMSDKELFWKYFPASEDEPYVPITETIREAVLAAEGRPHAVLYDDRGYHFAGERWLIADAFSFSFAECYVPPVIPRNW